MFVLQYYCGQLPELGMVEAETSGCKVVQFKLPLQPDCRTLNRIAVSEKKIQQCF